MTVVSFISNYTSTTINYTLSLHDALPISRTAWDSCRRGNRCANRHGSRLLRSGRAPDRRVSCLPLERHRAVARSEEQTSELHSLTKLVCRLLLDNKLPIV